MSDTTPPSRVGSVLLLRVFLRLGLTSFGGPVAHLGFFRSEVVHRRGWMSDSDYAELVALCQTLPGPASSQVGFGIGWRMAGWRGALAAFAGFTLPSAVAMTLLASAAGLVESEPGARLVTALEVVACAVVAQAVWGMAKLLVPDARRALLAGIGAASALVVGGGMGQLSGIALGAVGGLILCRGTVGAPGTSGVRVHRGVAIGALIGVVVLVSASIPMVTLGGAAALFGASVRAGALVFGGGHVVLPLLQEGFVATGWVTSSEFLAAYGAAQAMPGPLFTIAATLGALAQVGPGGALGAGVALVGIFLPGFLLLVGVLPFWTALRRHAPVRAALDGVNAAVVGLLAAALYDPVFLTAVTGPATLVGVVAALILLMRFRLAPWLLVALAAAASLASALL